MAWHLALGYDEAIMRKVSVEERNRQKYLYSILSVMILVIGLVVFVSTLVYLLIIFNSWVYAILGSLFFSFVIFNLYRFLIVSAIDGSRSGISEYHLNHELTYDQFYDNRINFSDFNNEKIEEMVSVKKEKLRDQFDYPNPKTSNKLSTFSTMLLRVTFLVFFAIIFSTGFQIFLFKNQLNESLDATYQTLLEIAPESTLLTNEFVPRSGDKFLFIKSSSFLMIINLLNTSLGDWKFVLDFIFLIIFLIPIILIFKSNEILRGGYTRELVLNEITISHYHYLKTQQYCSDHIQFLLNQPLPVNQND
jgi:hypothetical protein